MSAQEKPMWANGGLDIDPTENGLCCVRCECGEVFYALFGSAPKDCIPAAALEHGWTTDSYQMHCPGCPPLEIPAIEQAKAMVHGYDLLCALVVMPLGWDELDGDDE
jgi:hypothetical protein